MVWFVITLIFSTLLDVVRIGRLSDQEKDLEIMILRHQLDILARKQKKPIKPSQAEKFALAILVNKLRQTTNRPSNQLKTVIRLFQPATVLKWHRQLVRRKWTQDNKGHVGRPKISQDTEVLILRLAKEKTRWGYGKIEGELRKLGIRISLTTIRNILNRLKIAHYVPETFVFCRTDPRRKSCPGRNARVPEVAARPLKRAVMLASIPCVITLPWPIQRFMPW